MYVFKKEFPENWKIKVFKLASSDLAFQNEMETFWIEDYDCLKSYITFKDDNWIWKKYDIKVQSWTVRPNEKEKNKKQIEKEIVKQNRKLKFT